MNDFYTSDLNKKFGNFLKESRMNRGLTQNELSDGICDRRQIIRYENGDAFPSIDKVYLLSQKLGIDLMLFFKEENLKKYYQIKELENSLDNSYLNQDYTQFKHYLDIYKRDVNLTDIVNLQCFTYYQSIYSKVIQTNPQEIIDEINDVLEKSYMDKSNHLSYYELQLVNIKAVLLYELNQRSEALTLLESLLKKVNYSLIEKKECIIPKLFFNIANIYFNNTMYTKTIHTCEHALDIFNKYNIKIGLGKILYLKGLSLVNLGDLKIGHKEIMHSLTKIKDEDFFYYQKISNYIKDLLPNLF